MHKYICEIVKHSMRSFFLKKFRKINVFQTVKLVVPLKTLIFVRMLFFSCAFKIFEPPAREFSLTLKLPKWISFIEYGWQSKCGYF